MKRCILLLLMFVSAFSSEVCGQSKVIKSYQRTEQSWYPRWFSSFLLPRRDTVIIRGDEIEVGGYLSEEETKDFEIIGYGKAKKSDYKKFDHKKGIYDNKYSIKLKPQRNTVYEFRWIDGEGHETIWGRKVYVAENEQARKIMQKQLNKRLRGQSSTYQYVNPNENVKISAGSIKKKK